jgi:hypothetical protein
MYLITLLLTLLFTTALCAPTTVPNTNLTDAKAEDPSALHRIVKRPKGRIYYSGPSHRHNSVEDGGDEGYIYEELGG